MLSDIVLRVIDLRKKHRLSQGKLAKRIGVSAGNIGEWERGKASPSITALAAISKEFNVSIDWLVTGREFSLVKINDKCQHCLVADLSEEDRQELQNYMKYLSFKRSSSTLVLHSGSSPPSVREPAGTYYLPIVGQAAAGSPMTITEMLEGYLPVDRRLAKDRNFVVRVKGDSMIGKGIGDGDLVVVHPQPVAENGEIVLARLGDEATIKVYRKVDNAIELIPANPLYSSITIDPPYDGFSIVGTVLKVIPWESAPEATEITDY